MNYLNCMMNNDSFKLNLLEGEVNKNVIEFLREILPFEYSSEIYEWEYNHEKKVLTYLTDLENKVVGVQGFIPIELVFHSNLFLSAKSESSYLSNSVQGKGLFKLMYKRGVEETFKKNISIIWGFTLLGKVWEKLNFDTKGECLGNYVLILKPDKNYIGINFSPMNFLRYIKTLFKYFKLRYYLKKYRNTSLKIDIIRGDVDVNIISIFYNKWSKKNQDCLRISMDKEFIQNRIIQNPFIDYECFYAYEDDDLLGYCILAKNDKTPNIIYISELIVLSEMTYKLLLNKIIEYLVSKKNIFYLKYFGNNLNNINIEVNQQLELYGANYVDSGLYIVCCKCQLNNDLKENVFDYKKWYINGLWTEGVNQ